MNPVESGDSMKAPVKAGGESRMQEPYKKGVANHLVPESCADAGNGVGEALTGAHAGQPSSSEITSPGVPTLYGERGSGDIYEQAVVKPVLSLSKGRSRDFFAGVPNIYLASPGSERQEAT